MKKIFASLLVLAVVIVPSFALAQFTPPPQPNYIYVDSVKDKIISYAQIAITFLMVMATFFFLWSVVQFIREKDPAKANDRKKIMFNGIIGLFIMVCVWGIIKIIGTTLGIQGTGGYVNPTCPPGQIYNQVLRICQ